MRKHIELKDGITIAQWKDTMGMDHLKNRFIQQSEKTKNSVHTYVDMGVANTSRSFAVISGNRDYITTARLTITFEE